MDDKPLPTDMELMMMTPTELKALKAWWSNPANQARHTADVEARRQEIERLATLDFHNAIMEYTRHDHLFASEIADIVYRAIHRGDIRGIGIKEQG